MDDKPLHRNALEFQQKKEFEIEISYIFYKTLGLEITKKHRESGVFRI